ncbi:hypothetical protein L6R52_19340 [Myxococcota bacterium]|nr:hypothetical protein [Myxococcota bacterium]
MALPAPALARPPDASPSPDVSSEPVGLSLWWEDGQVRFEGGAPRTVTLYGAAPRFLEELDLTANVATDTDRGITPLTESGDFAALDWSGVELVDEDWRPEFTGGFTRSRFYRGAAWMERPSLFILQPLDARGRPTGAPLVHHAGSDQKPGPQGDGFVRRFVARQVTPGCRAIGDCSNATQFLAQGLVQLRGPLSAALRARTIPAAATRLQLTWTEDIGRSRTVEIQRAPLSSTPYRYGFSVDVEVTNPPANGAFYVPGETLQIRTTFRDGDGQRLHAPGTLPTYGEFLDGSISSGLRYYDGLRQLLTAYYALKHREGLAILTFGGPTHRLRTSGHQVGFDDLFFTPQTVTAVRAEDGYTGLFQLNPPIQNQAIPDLWYAPVSDTVPFVIPADAEAGTYVIAVKGRRDWGGQAKNAAGVTELQVGQSAPTTFAPATGRCTTCHVGPTALGALLHGLSDRRTCFSCHPSMAFEPDHALDYRIHLVHSRSERVPADVADCSTCHLTPPSGPARGFPGIGPF